MTGSKQNFTSTKVSPANRARLLICDDQPLIRRGVREMLRDVDFIEVVGEAVDGREAVSMALNLRPDIILMDVSMPELDGIEATTQILAQLPRIAVLGYSADFDEGTVRRMLSAGARGFLAKTGNATELAVALTRVLRGEQFVCIQAGAEPPSATGSTISQLSANPFREERKVRVLLAEESATVRQSLRAKLTGASWVEVVAEVDNSQDAITQFFQLKPDVVVLSACLKGQGGFEVLRCIRRAFADCVAILTIRYPDAFIKEAGRLLGAAAVCCITDHPCQLLNQLRRLTHPANPNELN